ncbi:MAG: hypothetical protein C0600_03870 [Ignavibacteria bacterium]|nr:MAG: hypothetical protein C0600_03870 [Ignavibacteria bacterium]
MEKHFSDFQLNEVLYALLAGITPGKQEVFMEDLRRQIADREDVRSAVDEVVAHPMAFTEGTCIGEDVDEESVWGPVRALQTLLDKGSAHDWMHGVVAD